MTTLLQGGLIFRPSGKHYWEVLDVGKHLTIIRSHGTGETKSLPTASLRALLERREEQKSKKKRLKELPIAKECLNFFEELNSV